MIYIISITCDSEEKDSILSNEIAELGQTEALLSARQGLVKLRQLDSADWP